MRARLGVIFSLTVAIFGLISVATVVAAGGNPFIENNVELLYQSNGELVSDGYGWIARRLNDFNDDGIDDYLVTAPFHESFSTFNGRVYVYSGIDGSLAYTHTGAMFSLFGWDANAVGDFNDDTVSDYVIGAPNGSSVAVYSGIDHQVIFTATGTGTDWFGSGVNSPGDVDGDDVPDLFVGAPRFSLTTLVTRTGKVQMISGADGSELWSVIGEDGQHQLGNGANVLSDLDNDGVNDVIASASGFNGGNGKVYVYSGATGAILDTFEPTAPLSASGTFGGFFMAGQQDVNGDGTGDIYIGDFGALSQTGRAYVYSGATLDNSVAQPPLYQFEGAAQGDGLGVGRLIPDANADGKDDIIVASYLSSAVITGGGKIEIYSGNDGALLHTASGAVVNDNFGVDALYLGDLNGDGRTDYLGTSVGLDFVGQDVGRAYVFSFENEVLSVAMNVSAVDSAENPKLLHLTIMLTIITTGLLSQQLNKRRPIASPDNQTQDYGR